MLCGANPALRGVDHPPRVASPLSLSTTRDANNLLPSEHCKVVIFGSWGVNESLRVCSILNPQPIFDGQRSKRSSTYTIMYRADSRRYYGVILRCDINCRTHITTRANPRRSPSRSPAAVQSVWDGGLVWDGVPMGAVSSLSLTHFFFFYSKEQTRPSAHGATPLPVYPTLTLDGDMHRAYFITTKHHTVICPDRPPKP